MRKIVALGDNSLSQWCVFNGFYHEFILSQSQTALALAIAKFAYYFIVENSPIQIHDVLLLKECLLKPNESS